MLLYHSRQTHPPPTVAAPPACDTFHLRLRTLRRRFFKLSRSHLLVSFSPYRIMDAYREEKLKKLEEFVDRRMKPRLVQVIAERDKVLEQQKIFSDLKKNIQNLEDNSVTRLDTLVNLGSEVYMQAEVPDTRHIFVDIGMGFHVEFTWSEALKFISMREEKLSKQLEEHCKQIATINAEIKMVCEGIRELLQIPPE
ncbi:UXT-like protein [Drosera capensis]